MNPTQMKYTATNDSVTVIWDGRPVTVKRGAANFEGLRRAILKEDWAEVPFHLRSDSSLERWAQGKFKVVDGGLLFNGEKLPPDINARIVEMATLSRDPSPLMRFWERLQKNPSMRSVEQLWRFLNNSGIPITEDGCFLAYKAVKSDFTDVYSGTINNRPGEVVEMQRNKISDDPNEACHYGLHVGALEYAESFHSGGRMVICKVDPADVVCVPFDASSQKMRVCRYEVVGIHGEGHLPSTTIDEDDIPSDPYDNDSGYWDAVEEEQGDFLDELAEDRRSIDTDVLPPLPRVPKGKRPKKFQKLDAMDETELFQQPTDVLRKYASAGLRIVGASRIPGGKWALIRAISRARG